MNRSWTTPAIIIIVAVLFICCFCIFAILGAASWLTGNTQPGIDNPIGWNATATNTPIVIRPTIQSTPISPATINPTAVPTIPDVSTGHQEKNPALTLRTLSDTVAPINDPEYVVSVVVERGGSGGRVAAPITRQVLQFLLNGPSAVTPLAPGLEAD